MADITESRNSREETGSPEIRRVERASTEPNLHSSRSANPPQDEDLPLADAWIRKSVLSLDGGGIRGYSSLIILRTLIDIIRKFESAMEDPADSSYHPGAHRRKSDIALEVVSNGYAAENVDNDPQQTTQSQNQESENELTGPRERRERDKFLFCHYVDFIGGTSTGGLISIMLGRLRMTIDDCLDAYKKFGGKIFGSGRKFSQRGPIPVWWRAKYDGKKLQETVEEIVAENLPQIERRVGAGTFSSSPHLCKTLCFAYDSEPINTKRSLYRDVDAGALVPKNVGPYIFRSYDHWATSKMDRPQYFPRNPGVAPSIPIWQVACATTAAPTYFDPVEIGNRKYGDGGFGTNNPVVELHVEVDRLNGTGDEGANLMISVGTGQSRGIQRVPQTQGLRQLYEYWRAAKKLASDSETEHQRMHLHADTPSHGWTYHRLNVSLEYELGNMKLDEWKRETTLERIEADTVRYCSEDKVRRELEDIALKLVHRRRARCKSPEWNFFATGAQYRCVLTPCSKPQKLFRSKEALRKHFKAAHPSLYDPEDHDRERELFENGRCT